MHLYQREFLELAITKGVLRFGEFTLKSGRTSPYFFNAGLFDDGASLAQLGKVYAQAIIHADLCFDTLFGPAYKGIPLVTATAMALALHHRRDYPWCFNRKEAKDHGEGGQIVGAPLTGRVLIVDDVMTAGTAIRESMALLEGSGAQAAGVIIALDRQERGERGLSAVADIKSHYQIPVISVARLEDLIAYLKQQPALNQHLSAMINYRNRYGAA
jgi:orotate phosphoribosyltransferase